MVRIYFFMLTLKFKLKYFCKDVDLILYRKYLAALIIFMMLSPRELYADDWLELVQKYTSADKINYVPDKWETLVNNYSGVENVNILAQWWAAFDDKTLTLLIEKAFNENKDLKSARSKVREARAQLGISQISLAPSLNGNASFTNSEPSKNSINPVSVKEYQIGVDASWEIDLFGRKQDTIKAAKADYEAQQAALHSAWVSLSAEVAMNYINLRTLQAQLDVANNNIRVQRDVLNLLQSQYDAGLKDALALQQAKYTLDKTEASVPSIKQSIEEIMNALAILTGDVPGSLNGLLKINSSFPRADSKNLIGIPADTIRQRWIEYNSKNYMADF